MADPVSKPKSPENFHVLPKRDAKEQGKAPTPSAAGTGNDIERDAEAGNSAGGGDSSQVNQRPDERTPI